MTNHDLTRLGHVLRRQMRSFLATKGFVGNTYKMKTDELKKITAEQLKIGVKGTKRASHIQLHEELKKLGFMGDAPKFDANILLLQALNSKLPPKPKIPRGPEFYQTDEWREVRYRALKLHGGCCQCCGSRPRPGHPLHVDHIKPRSRYPELELDFNNLQVLCEDCNLGKRAWDETDWRNSFAHAQTGPVDEF